MAAAAIPIISNSAMLTGLERAAVLVMYLDREAGRGLLAHLSSDEIERLGLAMARVEHVTTDVVTELVGSFVRDLHEASLVPQTGARFALNVLPGLVDEARRQRVAGTMRRRLAGAFEEVVASRPARTIAAVLREEHIQTQAAALALMGPTNAGRVLTCLDEGDRHELTVRIARMDDIPGELADLIESMLIDALSDRGDSRIELEGAVRAAKTLGRVSPDAQAAILSRISQDLPPLAEELRRSMVTFEDLQRLGDRSLQAVLKGVDKETLVLALRGATPTLRDAFLRNMSSRAAADLLEEMEIRGPQPRNVVEGARDQVIATIMRLSEEGVIPPITGDEGMV